MSRFGKTARPLAVLLALSLGACAAPDAMTPSQSPAPSNPNVPTSLEISASNLIMGQPATMTVSGLAPGRTAHVVASLREGSSCPPQTMGVCVDLTGRVIVLGSVVADDEGNGILDIVAPSANVGSAFVQAFVTGPRSLSPVLSVPILVPDNDEDKDGLTNLDEFTAGTDLWVGDSDSDGLLDGEEVHDHSTDPLKPDTDLDGLTDGQEVDLGTDPLLTDSDDDGLEDGAEVLDHGTDPTLFDTDGDDIDDGTEITIDGTNPSAVDTDFDGCLDADDLDPLTPNDLDVDGICDQYDLCMGDDATGDPDADGLCTDTDPCPDDPANDSDNNGVCDGLQPSFVLLGEGECRQADGRYGAIFSRSYDDLAPHTVGDHAQQATALCEQTCADQAWCVGFQVTTNAAWSTPYCDLLTDQGAMTAAGAVFENATWGGHQMIDGYPFSTYCGSGAPGACEASDFGVSMIMTPREGFHCYKRE